MPCRHSSDTPRAAPSLLWDIYGSVVDNWGDVGVCWRLAVNLAQRGQRVRLWLDASDALAWMAPQGAPGVQVLHWKRPLRAQQLAALPVADVLIEAFGCALDHATLAHWARRHARGAGLWLNLEYLSAEDWSARCHLLPSPVQHGAAAGRNKWFFYPGFSAPTGGLLREPHLLQRQQAFKRSTFLAQLGADPDPACLSLSLFCYAPAVLPALLRRFAAQGRRVQWLVTTGLGAQAMRAALQHVCIGERQRVHYVPALTQEAFDQLLWSCHCNFVRGEDSLVRALWAGRACVWQIYPQDDWAHHAKLEAFLHWLRAPAGLRRLHHLWNAMGAHDAPLPALHWSGWQRCVARARAHLLSQSDLASQLLALALKAYP